MDNKLQDWTTPRLMRLNQVDGTEKHVPQLTEAQSCSPNLVQGGGGEGKCSGSLTAGGPS